MGFAALCFVHFEGPLEDPDGSEFASEGPETAPDEEGSCKSPSKAEGTDTDPRCVDLEMAGGGALSTQPILDPVHVINVDVMPLELALSLEETPVESVSNSVRLRTVLCGMTDGFVVRPLGRSACRPVVGSSSDSESLSSELDQNLVYTYVTTTRRLHTVNVIEVCPKKVNSARGEYSPGKNLTLIFMLKPMIRVLASPNEGAQMTITAYTIPAKELQVFAANSQESNLRRDRRMRSFQRKLNEMRVKTVSARRSPGTRKRIRHLVSEVEVDKKLQVRLM